MNILPMKVLLVVRGGPTFLGLSDGADKATPTSSHLFIIEKADDLSPLAPKAAEEKPRFEACVLPASTFLENQLFTMPVPIIAYGGSDMAWPCFDAGAFDFMREGWTLMELEARLYRLFSPVVDCQEGFLALRDITLTWRNRGIDGSSKSIMLTWGEAELLRCLLVRRGRAAAADSLPGCPPGLPGSHGSSGALVRTRALSMRVSRLKAKLSGLHEGLGMNIEAVRGAGYLWIHR